MSGLPIVNFEDIPGLELNDIIALRLYQYEYLRNIDNLLDDIEADSTLAKQSNLDHLQNLNTPVHPKWMLKMYGRKGTDILQNCHIPEPVRTPPRKQSLGFVPPQPTDEDYQDVLTDFRTSRRVSVFDNSWMTYMYGKNAADLLRNCGRKRNIFDNDSEEINQFPSDDESIFEHPFREPKHLRMDWMVEMYGEKAARILRKCGREDLHEEIAMTHQFSEPVDASEDLELNQPHLPDWMVEMYGYKAAVTLMKCGRKNVDIQPPVSELQDLIPEWMIAMYGREAAGVLWYDI